MLKKSNKVVNEQMNDSERRQYYADQSARVLKYFEEQEKKRMRGCTNGIASSIKRMEQQLKKLR